MGSGPNGKMHRFQPVPRQRGVGPRWRGAVMFRQRCVVRSGSATRAAARTQTLAGSAAASARGWSFTIDGPMPAVAPRAWAMSSCAVVRTTCWRRNTTSVASGCSAGDDNGGQRPKAGEARSDGEPGRNAGRPSRRLWARSRSRGPRASSLSRCCYQMPRVMSSPAPCRRARVARPVALAQRWPGETARPAASRRPLRSVPPARSHAQSIPHEQLVRPRPGATPLGVTGARL